MGPTSLPESLVDGLGVREAVPVRGGDIAEAYRLQTADGPLFLKTTATRAPGMFAVEAAGLRALRDAAPESLGVPEVVRQSDAGLVLQWIDVGGGPRTTSDADLGRDLAQIHRSSCSTFGGVDGHDRGYIGAVPVDHPTTTDWPEFYLEARLRPLVGQAIAAGSLPDEARRVLDDLAPRVSELCGPAEPPSLVHGDLWGGNRVVDASGRNWLIDPACHYAHREVDLAMMQMFGGFGDAAIDAYDEAFPLQDGWRERVAWYQLVPLLVHAILFGARYGTSALATLRRYS